MGNAATVYLNEELKRCGLTYKTIAARMTKQGLTETEASVAEKLRHGRFDTEWFLMALRAISAE